MRPVDRPAYVAALQHHQAGGGAEAFDTLLWQRLEATLTALLNDQAQREALGKRGRARVLAQFGWPTIVAQYRAFLADVARAAA